jgi:hypothetical protein
VGPVAPATPGKPLKFLGFRTFFGDTLLRVVGATRQNIAHRPLPAWSIFRRSGNRFAVENATKQTKLERFPIPAEQKAF